MIFDKRDFIKLIHAKQIKAYNFDYLEKQIDKEWILLIGNDNTLTGAPLCLYELALCIKDIGYIPIIATPREGKLIEYYKANLIPSITFDNLFNSDLIDKTLHLFSLTFVNTIVGSPLIRKFNNNGHNIIWWIHESEPLFDKEYVKYIPINIADNIKIYCVSDFAKTALIKRRSKLKANILTFGVKDMMNKNVHNTKQKGIVTFFNMAPITKNKGQDLLLEAINLLSDEVKKKARFIFAGEIDDKEIYNEIQTFVKKYPKTIEYVEGLTQEQVKKKISEIDCYVCSSRGESLSRTTIEACSAKKLIICSDNAGICKDLIKNESGLIYHRNDTKELSKLIETVIRNYSEYSLMRENARITYENKYTYECFNNRIKEIIYKYCESNSNNREYIMPSGIDYENDISFDIYMDVFDSDILTLRDSINSIRSQTYGKWNLKIINYDSENLLCKAWFLKTIYDDKRISKCAKYENEDSDGYVIKMSSKIILDFNALQEIKSHIEMNGCDLIYTDNIDICEKEKNIFKPDYSVDTLRSYNFIGNFYVVKKNVLNKTRIRDINNDYEVVLKVTNASRIIDHISKELYIQKSCLKQSQSDSNVISTFLNEIGYANTVTRIDGCKNRYRVSYEIKGNPLISIVICNKNNYVDLKRCIDSINKKSTYKNYEIIIIDNGSTDEKTLKYYDQIKSKRVKIVIHNIPFNYSKMNNKAIEFAKGEHYLFLNNDIEVISNNWLEEMLMYSQRDDVGAVGAKLYYPNNKIQHMGVRLNSCNEPEHMFSGIKKDSLIHREETSYVRNCLAVTAACLMVKASKFKEVGCFDEKLTVTFNDIDLCVKLYANKYNNICTPFAELYHFESKTRGHDCLDKRKTKRDLYEFNIFSKRWSKLLANGDPYFNQKL